MGKKRQSEPNMDNDNDSTESCDENQNSSYCPHIAKAIDLTKIKKNVATGIHTECVHCEKNPLQNGELDDDYEFDLSLWLCLRCGHQGCGRSKGKHALEHYSKPRSDSHALCVNTTIWHVWCYECDAMINVSSRKKLLETVEWLKKHSLQNVAPKPPIALQYHPIDLIETENLKNNDASMVKLDLPRVRGLTNLGNTCFFNSVMQCLAQTPFLQKVLYELAAPDEVFELPGGKPAKLNAGTDEPEMPEVLAPLGGTLTGWGPLTEVLYNTLKELSSGRMDVYNPRALLNQLTLKQPIFGGGDQHDSHELLRFLLEGIRSEDLRRYQTVILEKLGCSKKTDPSTVEGVTKQVIKFYGTQAADLMLRTDQVFRGHLVSTLQCQDCKHSSHRDEFILDLSLPVSGDKQMPPALRRKSDLDLMETEKPTKSQLKKEKRAARKARKHHPKTSAGNSTITEDQAGENKSESEESDADVEDNLEECKSPEGDCEDIGKGLESGYNSEKVSDASPELNALEIDSGVTSPLSVNVPSPMCAEPADSPNSGLSETNIELPSPQLQLVTTEEFERPVSRLSFTDKPTPMIEDSTDTTQGYESLFGNRWNGTVSARYQCDDGECSIQSCLNQFTSCELMTGNNRVACTNCTKNINGENGKSVCTNATKQLLISSPPAVLILHLKRFQVSRCFPRKMGKHVTFPLVLDMAPFCSNRCRDLPSIDEQQNKLLYSLYGIVEHSGTLHGGHYVAYVKVRPDIPADHYRWQFLSKYNKNNPDAVNKVIMNNEGGAQGDPIPPPGKWYYVSDSYVSEVPESKVLRAQAYLLFYERIL